jgi:hypothetical protein
MKKTKLIDWKSSVKEEERELEVKEERTSSSLIHTFNSSLRENKDGRKRKTRMKKKSESGNETKTRKENSV